MTRAEKIRKFRAKRIRAARRRMAAVVLRSQSTTTTESPEMTETLDDTWGDSKEGGT